MTTFLGQTRIEPQLTPCRVAASSNVSGTYSNGQQGVGASLLGAASTLTIDGVALENGDRVILSAQTNAYENGIYVLSGIGSVWLLTRSDDFQSAQQMQPGFYASVAAGSVNAGALFAVVEPQVSIVGTDDITFSNSSTTPSSVTLANNGLKILDTNASHTLQITPGSDLTANRIFTLVTGDAARTLTLTGDATLNQDVSSAGSPAFAAVTVGNSGLHVLDTNASHDLVITPGSDLTADRIFTITTGDAARTLDVSAANVTVSTFGASLVDDAANLNALTTLGLKRGDSDTWGGGGTSFAFTCAGIVATDVVLVSLIAAANNVAVTKCVAGAGTITVDFTADPGAGTIVNFLGIPTV